MVDTQSQWMVAWQLESVVVVAAAPDDVNGAYRMWRCDTVETGDASVLGPGVWLTQQRPRASLVATEARRQVAARL